jgi:hypothetical protein
MTHLSRTELALDLLSNLTQMAGATDNLAIFQVIHGNP